MKRLIILLLALLPIITYANAPAPYFPSTVPQNKNVLKVESATGKEFLMAILDDNDVLITNDFQEDFKRINNKVENRWDSIQQTQFEVTEEGDTFYLDPSNEELIIQKTKYYREFLEAEFSVADSLRLHLPCDIKSKDTATYLTIGGLDPDRWIKSEGGKIAIHITLPPKGDVIESADGETDLLIDSIPLNTQRIVVYVPTEDWYYVCPNQVSFSCKYQLPADKEEEWTITNWYQQTLDTAKIIWFILCLIITVVVETAIAYAMGYRTKRNLVIVASTNFVTNLLLNLLIIGSCYGGGGQSTYIVLLVLPLEIIVFIVEAIIFALTLKCVIRTKEEGEGIVFNLEEKMGRNIGKAILFSFIANTVTTVLGLFITFYSIDKALFETIKTFYW